MRDLYAQGDLLVERIDDLMPSGQLPPPHYDGSFVLAEGELTGHSHRIAERGVADLYDTPDGTFLHVTAKEATLVHDEHAAIRLSSGRML